MDKNKNEKPSAQLIRKKKALLILPVLVLPLLSLAFWILGGGSKTSVSKEGMNAGLNLQLPNASLKDDKAENKLSFYEQADMDSIKLGNQIKNDPFLELQTSDSSLIKMTPDEHSFDENHTDENETKVYQKIAAINEQLNNTPEKNKNIQGETSGETTHEPAADTRSAEKLDRLLQNMNKENVDTQGDEDYNKLNGMMDKIIDIQHPERIKASDHIDNNTGVKIYTLDKNNTATAIGLLDSSRQKTKGTSPGFYEMSDTIQIEAANAIDAVVHEEQSLTNGSIIKLRLVNDISILGRIIPKGNFIFGTVSLEGERLLVSISSIKYGLSILPVRLSIYDLDGLPGIYIPGAITRDAGKQGIDNASQNIGLSSLDPTLKMQVANAGIDAARTLISKKVKLIKVTVKAGYKILLQENNNH